MTTPRDHQRTRIERAEEQWRVAHPLPSFELWELDALARKISERAWWKKNVGKACRYNAASVQGIPRCIPMGHSVATRQPQDILTLLHGMAHIACGHTGSLAKTTPLHEPDFVKAYLNLIDRYYLFGAVGYGIEPKKEFKRFLLAEGVRTKAVSEATRQKMRDNWIERQQPSEETLRDLLRGLREMEVGDDHE